MRPRCTRSAWRSYDWHGRAIRCHRAQIRAALGFREATEQDAAALARWLEGQVLALERRPDRLLTAAREQCRALHAEPPSPERLERLVRSALHRQEDAMRARSSTRYGRKWRTRSRRSTAASPANPMSRILERGGGTISVTPLERQPEPMGLVALKGEVGRRWPMTSLLDMLKEADLRVGFTDALRTVTDHENRS